MSKTRNTNKWVVKSIPSCWGHHTTKQFKWFIIVILTWTLLLLFCYYCLPSGLSRTQPKSYTSMFDDIKQAPGECMLINDTDALSAIERAPSTDCKQQLKQLACRINQQQGRIHAGSLPHTCPLTDLSRYGHYVGCFRDFTGNRRILPGTLMIFPKENTPLHCLRLCFRLGYKYAGLEYGEECRCGNYVQNPQLPLSSLNSCRLVCPGNDQFTCGDSLEIAIYETGLNTKAKDEVQVYYVPETDVYQNKHRIDIPDSIFGLRQNDDLVNNKPVRLVYIMLLNGRAVRQMLRLLRVSYRPEHYYYIHVDQRHKYAYQELRSATKQFSNIGFAKTRFPTIWGGSSLWVAYLSMIDELLTMYAHWKWDFLINSSESDFPVLRVEELVAVLTRNNGKNFCEYHGILPTKFYEKQGMHYVFHECDQRFWKVGQSDLPYGVTFAGGSDWFVLHREFVKLLLELDGPDPLMAGLKEVYRFKIFSTESFIHTALLNSRFCDSVVNLDFKFTYWNSDRGCKCQHIHIVDWCGCSPKVFEMEDKHRLTRDRCQKDLIYSARKFEPIIDQDIINWVDRFNLNASSDLWSHPSWNSYWQCEWDASKDSALSSPRVNQLRALLALSYTQLVHSASLAKQCPKFLRSMVPVAYHAYKFNNQLAGILISFNVSCESSTVDTKMAVGQVFIKRRYHFASYPVLNRSVSSGIRSLEVGVNYDLKERVFRNYLGGIELMDTPVLRYEWFYKTALDPIVTAAWYDPKGAQKQILPIGEDTVGHQSLSRPLSNQANGTGDAALEPGIWTVRLLHQDEVLASTEFLVLPQPHDPVHPDPTLDQEENKRRDLRSVSDSSDVNWAHFYLPAAFCFMHDKTPSWATFTKFQSCHEVEWSSFYPDLKSSLSHIQLGL